MEGFSPDYKDDAGGSYDMIRGLFMRQFLKSDPITIQLSPMIVDVEENRGNKLSMQLSSKEKASLSLPFPIVRTFCISTFC